jgi:hypothetical protein
MTCDKFRVEINGEMRSRVEELLGPGNFRLLAAPHKPNGNRRAGSNSRSRGR